MDWDVNDSGGKTMRTQNAKGKRLREAKTDL